MDPLTMNSAFKTLVDQNPSLAQAYSVEQMQALVQQGIKMMAFDFGSGGHTNFNVIQQTLPSEMSASVFAQLAASQVEVQLNIATPKNEAAVVGNLDARVVKYDLALQTPNGLFSASFSQYIAIHGKDAYIITFTNRAEDATANRATFDQIAATFALLP